MESVESEKKETLKPVIFCNCSKSKCSYHVCRCFVARVYCVDDCTCNNCHNKKDYTDNVISTTKSASSSSAKHKIGCQCQKIKCETQICKCYLDEVGCSKRCRCQDCANSFGKKPEPMLRGAEYWKARSHKTRSMEDIMSRSTKVGTANQLSLSQEKLTDMNHLTVSTHPGSNAVASLTSHNIGDFQNVSQAESEKGTNFHGYSSALSSKQPCPSQEVSDESLSINNNHEMIRDEMDEIREMFGPDLHNFYSVVDDISEMLKDDDIRAIADNIIREYSNKTKTMKSESAGQPAAATMPCSPIPTTCCNSEDRTNQTEIDNQGDTIMTTERNAHTENK